MNERMKKTYRIAVIAGDGFARGRVAYRHEPAGKAPDRSRVPACRDRGAGVCRAACEERPKGFNQEEGESIDMTISFTRRAALAASMIVGSAALVGGADAQDKPTFALVQINQQALFFNQMNEGAQKAADAAGVELVIFNANDDPAAQNDAIENYIQQKVDGIIVVAIDVNGVMPAVAGGGRGRHPGGRGRRDPAGRPAEVARSASTTRPPAR